MQNQNDKNNVNLNTLNNSSAIITNDCDTVRKPLPECALDKSAPTRLDELITWDNVETLSQVLAFRALKTAYGKSGNKHIYALIVKLAGDLGELNNTHVIPAHVEIDPVTHKKKKISRKLIPTKPLSDAYDVVSTVKVYLSTCIGKRTADDDGTGILTKNGNPVDITRHAYCVANRYIHGEKLRLTKRVYLDDVANDGTVTYELVPKEWSADNTHDYRRILKLIGALELPARQKEVVYYRLRGIVIDDGSTAQKDSIKSIAKRMGVTPRAVRDLLKKVQEKIYTLSDTDDDLWVTMIESGILKF